MNDRLAAFASNKLLARNSIINLAGLVIPLLIALVVIPPLLAAIGVERLGVLTLIWTLIGYAALFDLGVGRAITNVVAETLGKGQTSEIPAIVWSGLSLMAVLGLSAGLVLSLAAPWLASFALDAPSELTMEIVDSTFVLCIALPFVVTAAGLRGALEAAQSFKVIAAIRVLFAFTALCGPLIVSTYSSSLVHLTIPIALGRVLAWLLLVVAVEARFRGFLANPGIRRTQIAALTSFGLWMTVSNILSPLLVNLDRFILAATVSLAAVAYYATPHDVVTKLLVIPAAASGVLFSAMSASLTQDPNRAQSIYQYAARMVWLALFPMTLIVVTFAKELLTLWLSSEFADTSFRVAQIIGIGILINGMAHLPFAALQAAKRPDITAFLHIVEFVPFVWLLWSLVQILGIEGAALAWALRVAIDFAVLAALTRRFTSVSFTASQSERLLLVICVIAILSSLLVHDALPRVAILAIGLAAHAFFVHHFLSTRA